MDGDWERGPRVPRLGPASVQLWRLNIGAVEINRHVEELLSADEKEHAARFVFDHTRRAFLITRTFLRSLLARYLDEDPRRLQFRYGPHGKPALDTRHGVDAPRISLSHSHGIALFAVSHGRDVGIDVERIRDDVDCDDLAQRFFTAQEVAALRQLPDTARRRCFFSYWTRKEAVVKATGEGMARPLNSFEVSPGDVSIDGRRWRVDDVCLGDAYAAAVCATDNSWQVTCYDYPHDMITC